MPGTSVTATSDCSPQMPGACSPQAERSVGQITVYGTPDGRLFKAKYYDCYLMVNIHSRFIVGAHMRATDSAVLATEMMEEILGILLLLRTDSGTE